MRNLLVQEDEKERLQALENYRILNSPSEVEYDRITELATIICRTPISLITLLDEKRQWFKSKIGLDLNETAREMSFSQYTIMDTCIFEVRDATLDERFSSSTLVTGDPYIKFYAGFPLIDPDGYILGTLCVIDRKPNQLDTDQSRALELLATEVMQLIVERRQQAELRNFEQLFKLSDDLICVADAEGNFTRVNPAFQNKLGFDIKELLARSIFDLSHPQDIEITILELQKLKLGAITINFVHRCKTADAAYKTIQWTITRETYTGNLFAVGRDISLQIEDANKLKISEAKSRATFENSLGLVCTHDFNGNILSINSAGANILGYSRDQVVTMSFYDFIEASRHELFRKYLLHIQNEGIAAGQMALVSKKGEVIMLTFNNVAQVHQGETPYVIYNGLDITENYLLEMELQRTAEMLEQTNHVAKVGGWQFDLLTKIVYWSSETRNIHGVGPDFQPNLETWLDFYPSEQSKAMISKAMDEASHNGTPWDNELQIVTCSGEIKWVKIMGQGVIKDGVCVRLYGSFQDINERKKNELEIIRSKAILSSFVEYTPAAVAMLDNEMCYIAASRRWKEDYGLTGQVTGASYYDLFEGNSNYEDRKARHQRILKGAVEFDNEDLHHDEITGEKRYDSWEMRPWYQEEGKIGGMMIFAKNVTAMVLQREELKQAKLVAEEASAAKSEFLANMSHEIRTPLNGVIGFTDLVLKTSLSDAQQQYLSIVNQSANALIGIINDILDFSKIEAGKMELDIERCDLYELTSQATDIITFQIQNKGLEMLLNIPLNMPRVIFTDSVRMKQILVNLLGNAAKFTEEGEIELKIEVFEQTENRAKLRFSVRDTGIGIKVEKLEKIFEAFSQEDGSTTKKYGGTGLGLTITNKLLALMDSKLQLYSTIGEGSTFFFDVTVRSEFGEVQKWENIENIKNVLIVDNNFNNRLIIRQMLLLENIHSVEAKTGFEALEILRSGLLFDVILMDYHMPYMDGLETVRKIRAISSSSFRELPVLLLSSSSDDEIVIKACSELGIHQRLLKPIRIQDLFHALSRLRQKESVAQVSIGMDTSALGISDDRITILVAEDNAINLFLVRTILKRAVANAVIFEAVNGLQVIDFCMKNMPDLILMDVQMPEMNGYEATAKIREMNNGGNVPIVALTAGNVKDERERCLKAGMDDFIVKPIVEDIIVAVLRKWLFDVNWIDK